MDPAPSEGMIRMMAVSIRRRQLRILRDSEHRVFKGHRWPSASRASPLPAVSPSRSGWCFARAQAGGDRGCQHDQPLMG